MNFEISKVTANQVPLSLGANIVDKFNYCLKMYGSGWVCAMYGSTLKGSGRDLDIIVYNNIPSPDIAVLHKVFMEVAGFELLQEEPGIFGQNFAYHSVTLNMILDCHVRVMEPDMSQLNFYGIQKTTGKL